MPTSAAGRAPHRRGGAAATGAAGTVATAPGRTLIKNTDGQPGWVTSTPPTRGPAAAATPIALVRSEVVAGRPVRDTRTTGDLRQTVVTRIFSSATCR